MSQDIPLDSTDSWSLDRCTLERLITEDISTSIGVSMMVVGLALLPLWPWHVFLGLDGWSEAGANRPPGRQ